MKPMLKYRGGKTKEIPHIMWHIPRFRGRYIEPFLGGGAMFFYLEPREAIVNDINQKLMSFYLGVRNEYPKLRKELDKIQTLYSKNRADFDAQKSLYPNERVADKNEELYYRLRSQFNDREEKEYSDALLYYFINKTAYSGMIRYNANGDFNVPFGRYKHLNTECIRLSHSQLLKRSKVCCGHYSKIFELCNSDDFLFLDPPYDCSFSDYGNKEYKEGFSEDSHRKLAEDFKNLPCKALMVIGRTPLISELYGKYIVDEYEKQYAVNIKNRFKVSATHIVVANYKKDNNDIHTFKTSSYRYPMLETTHVRLFERKESYGNDQ